MDSQDSLSLFFSDTASIELCTRSLYDSLQISQNIFPNLLESARISIWRKTKWRPKWRPPRYLCLLYLFIRSTDFHQIFTKNLEIYFQTLRNLLAFQNYREKNRI